MSLYTSAKLAEFKGFMFVCREGKGSLYSQ